MDDPTTQVSPAICICCCEPMSGGNLLSRNPNICASCSSMMDGMGDSNPVEDLSVEPHAQETDERASAQGEGHPYYHPAFDDTPTLSWKV